MITFQKRQKGICPLKLKIGACNDESSFLAYSVKQILPILFLLHNQLSQAYLELFLLCSILQLLLVCLSRFDMKMMTLFEKSTNFDEFFIVNLNAVRSPLSLPQRNQLSDLLNLTKAECQIPRLSKTLIILCYFRLAIFYRRVQIV